MKYCANKDIDRLIRQLIRGGWNFQCGGKHGRLIHPDGRPRLIVAKTPSDYRCLHNFRRDLRKACATSVPNEA
jgi:hypothetical protein